MVNYLYSKSPKHFNTTKEKNFEKNIYNIDLHTCFALTGFNANEEQNSQICEISENEISSTTEISSSSTYTALEDEPASSNVTQNSKVVDFSSTQGTLKDYISFARSEIEKSFLNGNECVITLRNVFGNENPEMIVATNLLLITNTISPRARITNLFI